jgi:hypothetical protein
VHGLLNTPETSFGCAGGDDDDLVVTGEAGQDWMSMPHHRFLCRDAPFTLHGGELSNAANCNKCW